MPEFSNNGSDIYRYYAAQTRRLPMHADGGGGVTYCNTATDYVRDSLCAALNRVPNRPVPSRSRG